VRCFHVDRIEGDIAVLDPDDGGETIDVPRGDLREGQAICMGQEYGEPGYFDASSGATVPEETDAEIPYSDDPQDMDNEIDDAFPGEEEKPWDAEDTGTSRYRPGRAGPDLDLLGSRSGNALLHYRGDNLGTYPKLGGQMQAFRQQAAARRGSILGHIAARLGRRVALHGIALLVGKWGLPAASQALGVGAEDLLFLIAQYAGMKGKRGRRGPHLHTVLKRIKRGDRYRHMLSKFARKAGIHHHAPRAHKKGRK